MSLQVENPPDELRESAPGRNGYRVTARWSFGKSGLVQSDSAPNVIPFTAPPRFGGMEGRWTPEDLLLAAIASCYTATFCALAEYSKFRYVDLDVEARGDLRKADTGYSLTEIAICPRLTIGDGEEEQRALCLLHKAKAACLVSRLLSVEPAFKPAATGGGLARRFCLRRQHRLGGCNMTMTLEAGSRVALKTVLFGTDFSACANAALSYARAIARRYGATLDVAHVMPTRAAMLVLSPEFGMEAALHEDERIQGYIEDLESQLTTIPHHVLTPKGRVADELARIVEEQNIDLLVLGTHGRTGVRRLAMGSIAEATFRRVRCPVLSVGPNVCCKPNPEIKFRHILCATNFTRDSLAAVPYATFFAQEDAADLTLFYFAEESPAGRHAKTRESLLRRLDELIPADPDRRYRRHLWVELGERVASPAQEILNAAERQEVDLIVLGVRGVRGSPGFTTHLSTTVAQVLTQARCPVLTVRG